MVVLALAPVSEDVPLTQPPPEPIPIVGGDVVDAGEYPEVVSIVVGDFECTGTAVARNLILTAAHCMAGVVPSQVFVYTGDAADGQPDTVATEVGAHPDFIRDEGAFDIFDYGYIVTQDPLPEPYAIPMTEQDEWDFAMQWDREVILVGYGQDDDGDRGVKREVTVRINGFSPDGLEFEAGGDGLDSCNGDSGGPAFVVLPDGSRRLVGIISRGSEVCGSKGILGTPHPGLCWVRDETGTDLTRSCSGCDCIDTTPPDPPDEGCGCRSGPAAPTWSHASSVVALLLLGRRRRRLASRGASCHRRRP